MISRVEMENKGTKGLIPIANISWEKWQEIAKVLGGQTPRNDSFRERCCFPNGNDLWISSEGDAPETIISFRGEDGKLELNNASLEILDPKKRTVTFVNRAWRLVVSQNGGEVSKLT